MANDRQWTGSCANVPESLRALALEFSNKANEIRAYLAQPEDQFEREEMALAGLNVVEGMLSTLAAYVQDHAYTLNEWGDAVDELYARLDDGEIITNAQGVALAGFLRRGFRTAVPAYRWANVAQGGSGAALSLADTYLCVRMADGFTGGIDQEGRVST